MKSGTSFFQFQFPFVIISREKYQELIIESSNVIRLREEHNIIELSEQRWISIARKLERELNKINLNRNAKGQFERRAK